MPFNKSISAIAVAAMVSVSALGCSDDDEDEVGTLQQNWTIAGSTDPSACGPVGATQMRLVVVDSFGFTDATQFAPCSDFRTSVTLLPDRYSATATFLGADGLPVSKTIILPVIDVFVDRTTSVTVDFALLDFVR